MEKLIPFFPKINLIQYDSTNHMTKTGTCLFIPKGPKIFAWFTYYNNQCICLFYNQEQNKIFTIENIFYLGKYHHVFPLK
jgi:hypothetical protein